MYVTAAALSTGEWLSLVGLLGAATAFFIGLWQYGRSQKWKRAEFLASEFRTFAASPFVDRALLILDYPERKMTLQRRGFPDDVVEHVVDGPVVIKALRVVTGHDNSDVRFAPHEVAIRDSFDAFLDGVSLFSRYLENGIVTRADLRSHLEYHMDIIYDAQSERLAPAVQKVIQDYIVANKYDEVQYLGRAFGHHIAAPRA